MCYDNLFSAIIWINLYECIGQKILTQNHQSDQSDQIHNQHSQLMLSTNIC